MQNAKEITTELNFKLRSETGFSKVQLQKAIDGKLPDTRTFELHLLLMELGYIQVGVDFMKFWNKI